MPAARPRKLAFWLLIAAAASALLTWREASEHHPPHLWLIEIVHFAFLVAVIALGAFIRRLVRSRT